MAGIGLRSPLSNSDTDSNYTLIKNIRDTISQNLRFLIMTNPGERIRVPSFGVGIKRFLFEQNVQFTKDQISSRIKEQASIFMPYIDILNVSISDSQTTNNSVMDNFISVSVEYTYTDSAQRIIDTLSLNITI